MKDMSVYNAFVYFMTNKYNDVLYVGVTNDLFRRVREHKEGLIQGFTSKYNVMKLVYYEGYSSVGDAIDREKKLKRWKRAWKDSLIEGMNPEWKDLMDEEVLL